MGTKIERYRHHENLVFVQTPLRGKHRNHCLCFQNCQAFDANKKTQILTESTEEYLKALAECIQEEYPEVCPRAVILYAFCRAFGMVTPVWECPVFEEKRDG